MACDILKPERRDVRMEMSVIDYLLKLPEAMHFAKIPERSGEGVSVYRMLSAYGNGSLQIIHFGENPFLILIADYTPADTMEKVTDISEDYIEISQFETDSSSFKVGRRKVQPVGTGIFCYVNTQKTTYVYCEKGKPVRFTKIILTPRYFDAYFRKNYGKDYEQSKSAEDYISKNPNQPELNFAFRQIRDCQAEGAALRMYLESKVLEVFSLIVKGMEQDPKRPPVKLDYRDIRGLKKTVTFMKNDLAAYPSGEQLARLAGMSPARFQLAFRKYYGAAPYEYLKEMRLNQALFLLGNSDYGIAEIAARIGYHNSGHFAKLFKNTYGMTPGEYRRMQPCLSFRFRCSESAPSQAVPAGTAPLS